MPTGAPAFEDFIPLLRSGDALVTRLALAGWQASASALRTWSDRGRMWGQITPTTGSGLLTLYRRPGLAAGDRVCHGTINNGTVTLSALNSSGITGSADIPSHTSSSTHLFDVIVSYADEQDMTTVYAGLVSELDSNSKWEGQDARFEALLKEQKRFLDNMIWKRLKDQLGTDSWGRPNLGYLSDPRQLARVHALLCVSQLYLKRGAMLEDRITASRTMRSMAMEEFNALDLLIDTNRDVRTDDFAGAGSIVVRRA